MEIKMQLDNLPPVKKYIEGAKERLEDLRPVWEAAHVWFMEQEGRQFTTQGKYLTGQKWEKLSDDYAARKKAAGKPELGGVGILYRDGDMFRSLTRSKDPNHIAIMKEDHAIFGTSDPKAEWHHSGRETRKRGGRLPERPIVLVGDAMRKFVNRAFVTWFRTGRLGGSSR